MDLPVSVDIVHVGDSGFEFFGHANGPAHITRLSAQWVALLVIAGHPNCLSQDGEHLH
jgi:hypothetical protein